MLKKKKITVNMIKKIFEETKIGAKDKNRKIEDISQKNIKDVVLISSKATLDAGFTSQIIAASGTGVGATAGTAIGMHAATVATTTTVATSTMVTTSSFATASTLTVGSFHAAGGATAGAAAGTPISPLFGTVIGAIVGAGVGVLAGTQINNKQKNELKALYNEAVAMQNTVIKDLEKEMQDLVDKYQENVNNLERYKYIVGLFAASGDLKNQLTKFVEEENK